MRKIAIDFDGVLANYIPGMASRDKTGSPIAGAKLSLRKLRNLDYRIIIWTSRPITDNLIRWFEKCEIPYDEIISKPDFHIFIDDRAIRFEGNWEETLNEIEHFKEWWKD
jgi:hypothetical protein